MQLHSLLNSALGGGEWSTSSPGHLTPGKEQRYPLKRRLGWRQSRSGRSEEEESLFPLPRIEFRIVQPIAQSLRYPVSSTLKCTTKIWCKDVNWLKLGQMTEFCQKDDENGSLTNVAQMCPLAQPHNVCINTSYWSCVETCSLFIPSRSEGHLHFHIARVHIGFPDLDSLHSLGGLQEHTVLEFSIRIVWKL